MRCVGRTATASVHISSVWRAYSQRVELGDSVSLSRTAEIGALQSVTDDVTYG
jgi:hypothetical protein